MPPTTRRHFLTATTAALAATTLPTHADDKPASGTVPPPSPNVSRESLEQILRTPVLNTSFLKDPVTVTSIDLLRVDETKTFLLRARSKDGVESVTVPHANHLATNYPILLARVIPAFLNQDARNLEQLLWDCYRLKDNYKYQGLALWTCVAAVEMCLLELMGQTAKRPLADFFGGRLRDAIPVYTASGTRGNTPEEELAHLHQLVDESGAKALKFRLGGRMNRNADSLPNRTETLIPLVRKSFGDAFTLYADSNSSYDVPNAIRIGRLMEAHNYAFYEEPVEFDDLEGTKQVADALTIPIATGEQEFSEHRFLWTILHRAADILQPDLHYYGGFIRSTRVARMAAAAGLKVCPHMSGGNLGYLDTTHFCSFTPNTTPYMEFKGNSSLPIHSPTSPLKSIHGQVKVPTGPGNGITLDPTFIAKTHPVTL